MPDVDIVFLAAQTGTTDIVFGSAGEPPPASEPGMQVSGAVASRWQAMGQAASAVAAGHADGAPRANAIASGWQDLAHRSAAVRPAWTDADRRQAALRSRWGELLRQRAAVRSGWVDLVPTRNAARSHWQRGILLQRAALDHCQRGIRIGAAWADHWQVCEVVQLGTVLHWQRGVGTAVSVRSWWQRGMRPLPGYWLPPVDPGSIPLTEHDLVFCGWQSGATDIIFGDDACAYGIRVPIRDTYIVQNDVTLKLLDGTPLSATALSISIDADSWTFGWSGTITGSELALVTPPGLGSPIELEAKINGQAFRLLAESLQRDRSFPASRIRISGRGIAAALADPYNPIVTRSNATAMTAQQLADAALTVSGVGIGWTIDWQLADWLVPIGAWNHTGTMIEAVGRIAAAAGGYITAAAATQDITIRHRWPVLPWDLATTVPDIILPAAAVQQEGIAWTERPDYNGVWVSGESQGVLAHVRRTGTIGDVLAQMVTDPLITHDDAARQRGTAILAETGRSATMTLSLQVLPETGVMQVGQIVRFEDGAEVRTGIVRSVSVAYQHPRLRQTIEVECHA